MITDNVYVKQIESQPGHPNAMPLEVDPGTGKKLVESVFCCCADSCENPQHSA